MIFINRACPHAVLTLCTRIDRLEEYFLIVKAMATIHIRTDEKLKKEASKVFKAIGLDMSNAVKLFLSQVIITQSIPFKLKTVNGFSPEEEKELIAERDKMLQKIKAGKLKPFDSVDALIQDLLK